MQQMWYVRSSGGTLICKNRQDNNKASHNISANVPDTLFNNLDHILNLLMNNLKVCPAPHHIKPVTRFDEFIRPKQLGREIQQALVSNTVLVNRLEARYLSHFETVLSARGKEKTQIQTSVTSQSTKLSNTWAVQNLECLDAGT
jgi:hypothetical protein